MEERNLGLKEMAKWELEKVCMISLGFDDPTSKGG